VSAAGGIGLLGGTFDPIHLAHLRVAEEVRELQRLDEIRLVPSAQPPHKDGAGVSSAADRLRMVELAVEGVPGMRAWNVELERSGPSYTVDTLRALRHEVGAEHRIVFALGFDAFVELATWREYLAIFGLADLVVMTRPPWPETLSIADFPVAARECFHYDPASDAFRHESGHGLSLQHVTPLDISATAIRERVATGRSIRFLVPAAVAEYVTARGLYGGVGSVDDRSRRREGHQV